MEQEKMKKSAVVVSIVGAAVLAALAGCGGGGGDVAGAPNTGSGSFQLKLNTASALTLNAGDVVQFPGTAVSFPEPMSALSWTVYTSNGAPALTLSNADCAVADKKSQATATEGKVTATWTCAAGLTAPAGLIAEGQYVLTLTAKDKVGNSATSTTQVTVRAADGVTSAPAVTTKVPATAVAGSTVTALCAASGGYTAKPGLYTYQWVPTPALTLATPATASTTFVAPNVTAPTPYTLTCRVTDDNQKTSTSSGVIVVTPPAAPTIVPSVPTGRAVTSSERVSLDGSATTWVDSYGATIPKPIYYNWVQSTGTTLSLFNANTPVATAIMPTSVAERTVFTFTLKTSDQPFNGGVTSGTVTSSADAVYTMDPNPVLSLATTFASSVDSGAYVTIPVTAKSSPATTLPLYYAWTQISGPTVALGGSTTSTLNFGAPVNTSTGTPIQLMFRVTVGYAPITVAAPGVATLDVIVVVDPVKATVG
jgi:hypothetical protein